MRGTARALLAIAWLMIATSAWAESASEETPLAPVVHEYRHIDGRALQAHVFEPRSRADEGPAAAILLFHGGGWSVGSPEWTFAAARRFAEQGMVAIAVEYRLSQGEVTPLEALDDVCASFRWARRNTEALRLDPERVAGYGVSAGGHLVASAATVGCGDTDNTGVRSDPDLLLLWSPALDMARDGWFERKLQGRASAQSQSPVEYVGLSTPPTCIVQGKEDTLTPLSGAEKFCERLIALGGTCELNIYEGVGHLLTRNLEQQERDFDPDPKAVAHGIDRHLDFLRQQGFLPPE